MLWLFNFASQYAIRKVEKDGRTEIKWDTLAAGLSR
jgi:hypothetical protein